MEIRDCLPLMTKIYLSRIVDSIFKENIPKGTPPQRKFKPQRRPSEILLRRAGYTSISPGKQIRQAEYTKSYFGQKRASHLAKASFAPLPLRPSRLERVRERAVQLFLFPLKEAEHQAIPLKYRNDTDTDIALIIARDLKYLAETWPKFTKNNSKAFDLNVFNTTGVLDRNTLDQRMKLLLG